MKVGRTGGRLVGFDEASGRWVHIGAAWREDLVEFLAGGAQSILAAKQLFSDPSPSAVTGPPDELPFAPTSLRDFSLWERHMVDSARGMVNRFAPSAIRAAMYGYERFLRQPFPLLRPKKNFARIPQFYFGNHRSVIASGQSIDWPPYSAAVDFELELGIIIARQVRNCSRGEALAAIGGFVVFNDCTARDVQWNDLRASSFGGMVKAKSFANIIGTVVVTADEILPRWDHLRGEVRVNGQLWCSGGTEGPSHDLADMIVYAAEGDTLEAGALLGTGTLPGCSGIERGRLLEPGDEVECRLDAIGSTVTRYGDRR